MVKMSRRHDNSFSEREASIYITMINTFFLTIGIKGEEIILQINEVNILAKFKRKSGD